MPGSARRHTLTALLALTVGTASVVVGLAGPAAADLPLRPYQFWQPPAQCFTVPVPDAAYLGLPEGLAYDADNAGARRAADGSPVCTPSTPGWIQTFCPSAEDLAADGLTPDQVCFTDYTTGYFGRRAFLLSDEAPVDPPVTTPTPPVTPDPPAAGTHDCGSGTFTDADAVALASAAGLDAEQALTFAGSPCELSSEVEISPAVLADDGTDESEVAGPGAPPAQCKVATNRIVVGAVITRFARNVPIVHFDLVTYFCYDGSRVFRKGDRNSPPNPAAVVNVGPEPMGYIYTAEYQGTASGPPLNGWVSFMNHEYGGFFTTLSTLWKTGLPILKWVWDIQESINVTQTVYADGGALAQRLG